MGSLDSFDLTEGGIEAASLILKYITSKDITLLERAINIYDTIIPAENFGGEYTALRWICRLLAAPESDMVKFLRSISYVETWYRYLYDNDFEKLKTYINFKYHFVEIPAEDIESKKMLRFLEDFILFSNPDRQRWEKTSEILDSLNLKDGMVIADIGSGSGYFTFIMAKLLNGTGKVYAVETNPMHIDYMQRYVKANEINNVEVVPGSTFGIGIDPSIKVDIVFSCSLFHIVYASFPEDDRKEFYQGIINALKPGGKLVVVDNALVTGEELPYHGPYVAKELLISQLYHYGFRLKVELQPILQRYELIFEYAGSEITNEDIEDRTDFNKGIITVTSGASLTNYVFGAGSPTDVFTERGKDAAELLLRALCEKTTESIENAMREYSEIIPLERFGEEYTAFFWICKVLKADPASRKEILKDPFDRDYYETFAEDDFMLLKKYLIQKYKLTAHIENRISNLTPVSELICFNNPNRNSWEQTDRMLDFINIRPGDNIADVGCGSGYFSYRFAKMTGETGKVYATETNKEALSYVEKMAKSYMPNITPVVSALNDAKLPFGVFDMIYMCSMYHAVYITSIEYVKDAFIASIMNALKDDGKLVVVDNEIYVKGAPPYYGAGIDRRLVIAQLTAYGFKFIEDKQFIPQRYILVFQKG